MGDMMRTEEYSDHARGWLERPRARRRAVTVANIRFQPRLLLRARLRVRLEQLPHLGPAPCATPNLQ